MHLRCMCWFGNFVIPVHVTVVWTYIHVTIYKGKFKHGQKKDKFTDKKYM